MLKQCSTITCILFLVSLISKITVESSDLTHVHIVQKLVEKAVHWRDVAESGTDSLNVYHHLVSSLTFMQATREMMPDAKLETTTGIDISSFIRQLEQKISNVRQNIKPTSLKGEARGGRRVYGQ
jgi:hypothetical protein|eukprot:2836023-Prymnesium_polylepis.1